MEFMIYNTVTSLYVPLYDRGEGLFIGTFHGVFCSLRRAQKLRGFLCKFCQELSIEGTWKRAFESQGLVKSYI